MLRSRRRILSQMIGFMSESSKQSNSLSLSLKSFFINELDFEIRFKCMSGFTTENAKFIMPLTKKMSYDDSFDICDRFGFTKQFFVLP